MTAVKLTINLNVFISLAVVMLAAETQIQLSLPFEWHPYLFIIFFATLFEYNFHRLVTYFTNKDALKADKHKWLREYKQLFFFTVFVSVIGFLVAIYMAKREVLIALFPVSLITFFYSVPFFKNKKYSIRLRDLPYLKIFLIAFVWSYTSILLPVAYSNITFDKFHLLLIFIERLLFIFSITIPFDIRDMEADKKNGLKTIPILLGENKALRISYFTLSLFLILSVLNYTLYNNYIVLSAFIISAISTYFFLSNEKIKSLPFYHYGILDGTIFLQGLLVLTIYYFFKC